MILKGHEPISIVTRLRAGRMVFDFQMDREFFLFASGFRQVLGPTQLPTQWVPRALSLEVKRPGSEADYSPSSSAEVKNAWNYTYTPQIRLHGVVLN